MAFIFSSLNAFSEYLSLTAIVPLLVLILNKESTEDLQIFKLFKIFRIEDIKTISIILILIFVFLVIISSTLRLFTLYFNGRLAAAIGTDLGEKILSNSLYQPLEVHIKTNSSFIVTTLNQYINLTVNFLRNVLQFFTLTLINAALRIRKN